MVHYREFNRRFLMLTVAATGLPLIAGPVFADSVPESIRIQQQAEKAYESHPVVPIERGNAHHRDSGKDDSDGTGGTYIPPPPPSREPSSRHDSNN
jgi:hypothetical protein